MITIARVRGIRRVIIDERKGRRIDSVVHHFQAKGTAGLLLATKQRGFVREVRPLLAGMTAQGYFLSTRLMNECLRRAGEQPI